MSYSLAIPAPSSLDGSDSYLRTIAGFPVLSAEEEYDYATRLKRDNDLEAARMLVLSHLRLVASIARGYLGYGLPQSDLIQEGNIGLMKAVRRFDPERGVRLVSFAIHWIKAEIHEFILKNWRMIKVATTKAQRKLFFNLRSMKTHAGTLTPGEVKDIARSLKVKPEEVVEMDMRMYGQDISLDAHSDDDESNSPIAYLQSHEPEPVQQLIYKENETLSTTGLENALGRLDERSRAIIERRWLRPNDAATLHELAEEYGISAERVRQIEQGAMKKLRQTLTA